MATNVLSKGVSNYKTAKSEKDGRYVGSILYLSPEKTSGLGNVCPWASEGCKASCLNTAGRGAMGCTQKGRLRKTKLFFKDKKKFFETLHAELKALERRADKQGKAPYCRLNGTSDINWAKFKVYGGRNVFQEFPQINFYDYTKDIKRCLDNPDPNYHLTFSRSEDNGHECIVALAVGVNVAVVFDRAKGLPKEYMGRRVINGDETDLRIEDPKGGVIVGLLAKGKARRDCSGFVVKQ